MLLNVSVHNVLSAFGRRKETNHPQRGVPQRHMPEDGGEQEFDDDVGDDALEATE